jgi:hypothetical protein
MAAHILTRAIGKTPHVSTNDPVNALPQVPSATSRQVGPEALLKNPATPVEKDLATIEPIGSTPSTATIPQPCATNLQVLVDDTADSDADLHPDLEYDHLWALSALLGQAMRIGPSAYVWPMAQAATLWWKVSVTRHVSTQYPNFCRLWDS